MMACYHRTCALTGVRQHQVEAGHERLAAPTHRHDAVRAHPIVNDGTAARGSASHQIGDLSRGRGTELLQQAGAQLSVAADLIEYGRWGDVYLWGVTVDELVRERREGSSLICREATHQSLHGLWRWARARPDERAV